MKTHSGSFGAHGASLSADVYPPLPAEAIGQRRALLRVAYGTSGRCGPPIRGPAHERRHSQTKLDQSRRCRLAPGTASDGKYHVHRRLGRKRRSRLTFEKAESAEPGGGGLSDADYETCRVRGASHDEAIQAASIVGGGDLRVVWGAVLASRSGATTAEIKQLNRLGISTIKYAGLRRFGASHAEALDALHHGLSVRGYGHGRQAGASHDEILWALQGGLSLENYATARSAGIDHDTLMRLHAKGVRCSAMVLAVVEGVDLDEIASAGAEADLYLTARRANSHGEIVRLVASGIQMKTVAAAARAALDSHDLERASAAGIPDLDSYIVARELLSHDHLLDLVGCGVPVPVVAEAVAHRVPVDDLLRAKVEALGELDAYLAARRRNSHDQVVGALASGFALKTIARAALTGTDVAELSEARDAGINGESYLAARMWGHLSHRRILEAWEHGVAPDQLLRLNPPTTSSSMQTVAEIFAAVGTGVIANEAHRLYRRWREATAQLPSVEDAIPPEEVLEWAWWSLEARLGRTLSRRLTSDWGVSYDSVTKRWTVEYIGPAQGALWVTLDTSSAIPVVVEFGSSGDLLPSPRQRRTQPPQSDDRAERPIPELERTIASVTTAEVVVDPTDRGEHRSF